MGDEDEDSASPVLLATPPSAEPASRETKRARVETPKALPPMPVPKSTCIICQVSCFNIGRVCGADACLCDGGCGSLLHYRCLGLPASISKDKKHKSQLLLSSAIRVLCPTCQAKPVGTVDASVSMPTPAPARSSSQPPEAESQLKEELATIRAQVSSLADAFQTFLAPPAHPASSGPPVSHRPSAQIQPSFASVAQRGVTVPLQPPVQPSIWQAIDNALQRDREEQDLASSLVLSGIPSCQKTALLKSCQDVLEALGLPRPPTVMDAQAMPQRKRGQQGPSTDPPLIKVRLSSPDEAKRCLGVAAGLKDHPAFSSVYLRPFRSLQDRKLIALRNKRARELSESADGTSEGTEWSFKVSYSRQGYPILRINKATGKPDWSFADVGWAEWLQKAEEEERAAKSSKDRGEGGSQGPKERLPETESEPAAPMEEAHSV